MTAGRRLLSVVVGLALAAGLLAGGWAWRGQHDADARAALAGTAALRTAEQEATATAKTVAAEMTTYSYATLDADFAWVDTAGTDHFKQTYGDTTAPIRKLIDATKSKAEGVVSDASGSATDADHVQVLLFVDQLLYKSGDTEPAVDTNRVVMDMVREGGAWLVDSVELR